MKAKQLHVIQRKWDLFSAAVLPPNCSAVQRTEMRRAFYAGAQGLLAFQHDEMEVDNEDEGAAIMQGIAEELQAFGALIAQGKA